MRLEQGAEEPDVETELRCVEGNRALDMDWRKYKVSRGVSTLLTSLVAARGQRVIGSDVTFMCMGYKLNNEIGRIILHS